MAASSDDSPVVTTTPSAQPDPEASSDGDASWTEDPITADPDEDRSVDAVIEKTSDADGV